MTLLSGKRMPSSLLLYDAHCGLCSGTVRFVLRHERRCTLRFAALDGALSRRVISRHPELRGIDAVVWVDAPDTTDERVASRSEAILRVASYLGGPWRLVAIGRLVPGPLRDRAYDLLARHRHPLGWTSSECFTPPPNARGRFEELI